MAPDPDKNPLSSPEPWNLIADEYVDVNVPLLGMFSEVAATRMPLSPQLQVIDVATGPGTLACRVAPHVRRVDAIDFSAEMVQHAQGRSRALGLANVFVGQGDGQALPYADRTFDLGFSMFGLMFFPDRVQGFRELHRVLRPGALALVSAWAPIDRSSYMRTRVQAMRAADPDAPSPATNVLTLDDPARFADEMRAGGFVDVRIEPVEVERSFASADALFHTLTRGNAPFALLRRRIGEAAWRTRLQAIKAYLCESVGPYPVRLSMCAFFGQGRRH